MTQWQSGDVEANGIRLHYTRTGGDKPPVVLAHGFSDNGLNWSPVARALEEQYDVIMIDARGHGRSHAPETGYGPTEHAGDVAGVITALGLNKPPVLGHSMGAATTMTLAATYPELVGAALLEDPPMWWMPVDPEAEAVNEKRWAGMRERVMSFKGKTREELIAAQRVQTPRWSDEELDPWADAKLQLSPNVLNRSNPAGSLDWGTLLRGITCPTLLIIADPAQGAIVTEAGAAALKELIPHLQVAHIEDAGHSIRRDQFARYMDVVRSFLAEHTA